VKRKAVYAGSFDPITKGHLDIIRRALGVFDDIIVAVAFNPAKETGLFTTAERVDMIHAAVADVSERVTADAFSGLLVEYCERSHANAIIRGLRAVSDFEYEFQMALMNRHLNSRVETYFMTAAGEGGRQSGRRRVGLRSARRAPCPARALCAVQAVVSRQTAAGRRGLLRVC
jgi:pantetheine-phosphate adenylyltransferase